MRCTLNRTRRLQIGASSNFDKLSNASTGKRIKCIWTLRPKGKDGAQQMTLVQAWQLASELASELAAAAGCGGGSDTCIMQ